MVVPKKKIIYAIIKLIFLASIFGVIYFYRAPIIEWSKPYLNRFWTNLSYQFESLKAPCQEPITFSLGTIDSRFKMSDAQVIKVVEQASAIWSKPLGKQLFSYATTTGELKINFVYDYRQETTNKLKKLGIVVGNDRQAYDNLKVKYDLLDREYQKKKAELKRLIAVYDEAQNVYNAEVAKWNKQGGAPKNIYDSLNQSRAELDSQLQVINNMTVQVNGLVADLNAEGDGLNQLIAKLNLNVDKYNTTGQVTGKEFQEGVYIQDESGRRIEVYEFSDQAQLIRLLAHELGHALSLGHSTGTSDIMYYLNEAGNDSLTTNDLLALKSHCKLDIAQ